jgi:hypothetical protein
MKTIVWDLDDVLNDLTRHWFECWWLPSHPDCPLKYQDLVQNPPNSLLGIEKAEYLASLDTFRLSDTAGAITPVPEVARWFSKNGERARHMVLTATPLLSASVSANWAVTHFGRWIRSINFVPSFRLGTDLPVYDQTKVDFLHWFGKADLFVDDNQAYIEEASKLGIQTVLFPQPWNKSKLSIDDTLLFLEQAAFNEVDS